MYYPNYQPLIKGVAIVVSAFVVIILVIVTVNALKAPPDLTVPANDSTHATYMGGTYGIDPETPTTVEYRPSASPPMDPQGGPTTSEVIFSLMGVALTLAILGYIAKSKGKPFEIATF